MLSEEEYNFPSMTNEQLAAAAHTLNLRASALKALADAAKREIRSRHPEGTAFDYGNVRVVVSRPKVFSSDKANEVLTDEELERITVTSLSGTLAKKAFGEDTYDLMTEPGTPRISFEQL